MGPCLLTDKLAAASLSPCKEWPTRAHRGASYPGKINIFSKFVKIQKLLLFCKNSYQLPTIHKTLLRYVNS